jgi:hypothetical protein
MSAPHPPPVRTAPLLGPEEILGLSPEDADGLLDRLEAEVPGRPRLVRLAAEGVTSAVVFGDTHGDWRSTRAPIDRFLAAPTATYLIGLGDYVDRAPPDCGEGSVANALWLLQLAAAYPDRVYLLTGNHETVRRIPALPHSLPEEVDQLWGPDDERYYRLLGLLERGPLAAITGNGAYLAHGGFPRGQPDDWERRLSEGSDDVFLDVTWSDCAPSRIARGVLTPFDEAELDAFLARAGCTVFLRGHDPDVTGRPLFHGHCLTLHTTRYYQRYGGVIYAVVPMGRPLRDTTDLEVVHAPSEGQRFPEP